MKILGFTNFLKFEKLNKNSSDKISSEKVSSEKTADGKSAQISPGDILMGKIISSKNQALTILMDSGRMLKIFNEGEASFTLGDTVDVEVKETGDLIKGVVTLKEASVKTEEEINDKTLKNLGVMPTPDKKEIAKLLKMNSIPITKENLEAVTEEKKFIGKLSSLLKEKLIDPLKLDINKNIKSILVDHINNMKDITPKETEELKLTHVMLSEKDIAELLSEGNKPVDSGSAKAGTNIFAGNDAELEVEAIVIKNLEESMDVGKYLTEKLDKVDYKSIVFNLKNNIENTIKNLIFLDKIVLGNDSVYKQIERLSKNLKYIFEKNNIEPELRGKIFDMVKEFTGLSFKENEKLDELGDKIIKELENSSLSSIEKSVLKSEIITIKSSINYINTLSDKVIFLQMPVIYDDKINNMDLYVKKKRGKEKMDPDNCSVYISLDTNNLETVKTYIEIKSGKPSINFKLADEKIKTAFENEKELLIETLAEKGFKDVTIRNAVSKMESGLLEEMEEILDERIIDVKL